jgi:hypothetical protein
MGKVRSFLQREEGSVLVIAALAMTALMGFAALVTDVGLLYAKRARLMDTADAAALAGAQELPVSLEAAEYMAGHYIERNGEDPSDFNVFAGTDPDYPGKVVRVTANSEVDFFFARVLGFTKADVGARAVATAGGATSATHVVPIGINKEQERIPGKEYTLKFNAPPDDKSGLGAGNFGALDLDGNNGGGANDYRERLKHGYKQVLKVGDIIIPESGNMAGPTEQGVSHRLNGCSHFPRCTIHHYEEDCPRVVVIPVYEIYEMQNKNKVKSMKIVGFAAFLLKDYSEEGKGNNSKATIKGYFLHDYVIPGDSDPAQTNYGVYGVNLIE